MDNTYILLEAHYKGVHTVLVGHAPSIREAIIEFKLAPFTYPDDFLPCNTGRVENCTQWDPNKTCDVDVCPRINEVSWDTAVEIVCKLYNVESSKDWDEVDVGNYVDEDCVSEYHIFEITVNGKVTIYPNNIKSAQIDKSLEL